MTLGQHGRAESLTTVQTAGIFREAMEGMRDHLERVHVGYQRTDPDATFMIEGLIGIYEVMLRDFVVHGVPENVGTDRTLYQALIDVKDARGWVARQRQYRHHR